MSEHFTPQGPYSAGGPFSSANANNIEAGIEAVDNAKADLTGATFTGAIVGNLTGNATGITSDNALTATTHATGTAPNQFYLLVMPASGSNKMAFGTRVYDGAATHDVVVVNSDGSSSIASYDGSAATIRAIHIFIGTVDPATYATVNEGDLWISA